MEENEIAEVVLVRGLNGLGLNFKGGKDQAQFVNDDGPFVSVVKDSCNFQNGSLKRGDKILAINDKSTEGLEHLEIIELFKRAGQEVRIKVWRGAEKKLTTQDYKDEKPENNDNLSRMIKKELGLPLPPIPSPVERSNQQQFDRGNDSVAEQNTVPEERIEDSSSSEDDSSDDDDAGDEEDHISHINAEAIFRIEAAENRIAHRRNDDSNLPPTVEILQGDKGEKIYLIGTAHFSRESCDDVRRVIEQTQPDVVMIELCRSRTDILVNDEETLSRLAGDVTAAKVFAQMRQKGVVSGLMTFLLLHMSAHITKQLGMAPGGEFRAAFQEARRIPGCKVFFGDRAVEVTLKRAFATLSIWQKLKFALHVLKDLGPIKPEDIEKLKEKDMLEQALGEMMEEFPQMTNVFLNERDTYLARSLQLAAGNEIRIANGGISPTVVVGVVGLGHAKGVKENFHKTITYKDMEKLMEVPKPSLVGKILKWGFRLALISAVGYGMWRLGGFLGQFMPSLSWETTNNTIREDL